uniref:Nucleolar protein 4 helical domain-containing protein n=2 Tax=Schistosoma mansoni TaxID=6183 RepID=A0A5K4F5U5_SCHMA
MIEMEPSEEPLDLRTGCGSSSQVLKNYENKYEHYVKRRPTYLELEFGRFVRRLTHELLNPDLSITQQSKEHLTQIEEACKNTFPQFDSHQIRLKIRAQLKLYRRNLKRVDKKISKPGQPISSLKPISSNLIFNSSMSNILYPISENTDNMISEMGLNHLNATFNTSIDNKNDNDINMINTEYIYLPNNSISNIPFIYPISFNQPPLIYHSIHNKSNPINSTVMCNMIKISFNSLVLICVTDLSSTTKYLVPTVSNITTGTLSMSSTTTPLPVFSTPNTTTSLLSLSLRESASLLIQTARLYKMFIQPNQSISNNHQLSISNSQYINNIFHGVYYSPELEDLTNIPLNLEHKLSKTNLQPK